MKSVRLQDKIGIRNFHENMQKVFEPVTKTMKYVTEEETKIMMLTSKENNKALEILNNKILEIMNDRGIIASFLLSPLSKITNPDNTRQFELVKDSNSNRVNHLLIHNTIPITLSNNLLTFRDSGKEFESKGELLKLKTLENY